MGEIAAILTRRQLDAGRVRERMYRAPTPRERERRHALWLLVQGWSASKVGELLGRDPHTVGARLAAFDRDGPTGLIFEQTGGSPRPGGPGRVEGGGAGRTVRGGDCPGELELEGGAAIRRGPLRPPARPQL